MSGYLFPFHASYKMEEITSPDPISPKEKSPFLKAIIVLAKLIAYAIALVITCGLAFSLIALLAPDLSMEGMQADTISDWKSMTILYLGLLMGTFLTTLFFRKIVDKQPFSTVGMSVEGMGIKLLKGIVWALGILTLSFVLLNLIGAIRITDLQFEWRDLLGFLLFFFIAALVEELIFRGYMIPLIAESFHFFPAILLAALVFALVHIPNANFTWIGFLNIFFGGVLMGVLFIKFQNLYVPLGLHWIWNYYQGNILGFGVSGHEVESLLSLEMNGLDWLTGGEFGLEGSVITTGLLLLATVFSLRGVSDFFGKEENSGSENS